ncbi:MAG: nicotinate-nicotinamide nucleotide adenylyltransferase, partial [Solirubrobacteraceae bacterium]
DTLNQLRTQDPDSELFLIVGGDVAAGLPRWRQPERVLDVATLAVAKRGGTPRAEVEDALADLAGAERARFFPMPRIEISSTEVRRRVAVGEPIRYLVPDAVAGYIEREGLYR